MNISRCNRGQQCSIRSHKHDDDLPYLLAKVYDKHHHLNNKEYYLNYYKKIMDGEYNSDFIQSFIRNIVDENNGFFGSVLLYTLFNTSLNMRLFFKEIEGKKNYKLYLIAREKYNFFCETNKEFAEAVPTFDPYQEYYEFIFHCYLSKKSKKSLFWNEFSEQVDDSDNILTNCISFL